jgi:hypothetical protein
MAYLKTRYRKLATGGAVEAPIPEAPPVTAAPILDSVVEPDELDKAELPSRAKACLRKPENKQYLYDESASERLANLHWQVVDGGLEPYSEPYFQEIERRLNKPLHSPISTKRTLSGFWHKPGDPLQSQRRSLNRTIHSSLAGASTAHRRPVRPVPAMAAGIFQTIRDPLS